MFSRAVRRQFVAPLRRNVNPFPIVSAARRTVTTDAASSHADKEAVPEEDDKVCNSIARMTFSPELHYVH
jgi:pyruvate dehydrogenase E1 component alpha subunit